MNTRALVRTFAPFLLIAAGLPAALATDDAASTASGTAFGKYVYVLAADDMEGRGLGTKGIEKAANWIEGRLKATGLEPVFGSSYRQAFDVKTGVSLEQGNTLDGVATEDWTPLGFSSSGSFEGELAFLGYGIEAPPIGYQELDGIDLKGKIAVILRYEPQERDDASPFDGKRPSRWSAMRYKTHTARERGAAAVIFVTGPAQDEEKGKLPLLRNDGPESPAGLPVLQVKTEVAQKWLQKAGIDLAEFQKQVDRDLRPRSNGATGVTVRGRVALAAKYAKTSNVAGRLPGKGALAQEVVVIGAHYDHLGYGGDGSMRPNEKGIHNGADDNASGTAAVLLAAEQMKSSLSKLSNRRTVVFALFSGEEVGLAGSGHFVKNPPIPMDKVVAMVNLDMVGQLRDDQLTVFGTESAPEWDRLVSETAAATALKVTMRGDGYGPSDQTSFYAAHIPVLHLFTGTHERYHTPDDDAGSLNVEGGARIADFTARIGTTLAGGNVNPVYARANTAPAMSGDSRGYGAYLGTIPDYRAMEDTEGGVLLSDVRPGGPADLAGIRGGDRIVMMAGTRIANLHDMTFALQDNKPGDTIDVIVLRNGEKVSLRATLGSRSERGAAPKSPASPAATPSQPATPAAPMAPASPATPAAPPASPAPPAAQAPPSPHSGAMAGGPAESQPSFYDSRPGRDFKIVAGKPFTATFPGEKHFADVRQLTFEGDNAEAYFSPDGTKLIYQVTFSPAGCDQQYMIDLVTGENKLVSTGKGRTTCGYFDWPEADRIIYASTETGGDACPPTPDRSKGYVWPLYDSYELWEAAPDGSNPRRLTNSPGYDAEATWCHRGGKLVFTSVRDGDLELYEMDEAGNVKRLTSTPGYDGGAFYSADCSEIVWRASRPEGAALEEFRSLLGEGLVRPTALEIFVMNADGSNQRQVTNNGAANFCPYFHPDGKRIIFSSNQGSDTGREFDLWFVGKEGGEAERITTAPGFDGFPQWSPDGQWIVWASNRADPAGRLTNLFIARWVE